MLVHVNQLPHAIGMASAARELSREPAPEQQVGLLRLREGLENGWADRLVRASDDLRAACDKYGTAQPPPAACDAFGETTQALAVEAIGAAIKAELNRERSQLPS